MYQNNAAQNQYKQMAVETASPEKLLIMLYDGAIRFLKQALKELNNNNLESSNMYLLKVQNIIDELIISLNMDHDISKNLKVLYEFFNERLVQANIEKNSDKITEVMDFLVELREIWGEAVINYKKATG